MALETTGWKSISDYVRRSRTLRFLETDELQEVGGADADEDYGLVFLRKDAYFGGVFVQSKYASTLQPLVNREGFVPNASFEALRKLLRKGIDLSVRTRAAAATERRTDRKRDRQHPVLKTLSKRDRFSVRLAADESLQKAGLAAQNARAAFADSNLNASERAINEAILHIKRGVQLGEALFSERTTIQILASVGMQMGSFVHEVRALLAMTTTVERSLDRLRNRQEFNRQTRVQLSKLYRAIGDLRKAVERQAAYLLDVVSPDARTRRSRQSLRRGFDRAARLFERAAHEKSVTIENHIPESANTIPMFPAELSSVFTNLLTNALKAVSRRGKIRATAEISNKRKVTVRIENTGVRVSLRSSEQWFRPFQSTSGSADPLLGQGMGMGLPITRDILEEYGATIEFVRPSRGFSTAIEIGFN